MGPKACLSLFDMLPNLNKQKLTEQKPTRHTILLANLVFQKNKRFSGLICNTFFALCLYGFGRKRGDIFVAFVETSML